MDKVGECDVVNWMHLDHKRDQQRQVLVNTVIKFHGEFLDQLSDY
jgi:hypothetical protein